MTHDPTVMPQAISKAEHALAQQVGQVMMQRDAASHALGIQLCQMTVGRVEVRVSVTAPMQNGFALCHGGITYTLADTAFGLVCNARNQLTVAQHCTITYCRPVDVGDTLTAMAEERALTGRNGVYDVTVYNQRQEIVAIFQGASCQVYPVRPTISMEDL